MNNSNSEEPTDREPYLENRSTYPSAASLRKNTHSVNNWLVAILLILMVAMFLKFTNGGRDLLYGPSMTPRAITPRGDLAEDEKSTIELFAEAAPSVVFITTSTFQPLRGVLNEIPKGSGSGFVWDQDGNIVTNYHVIQGSNSAKITLQDQSVYQARLVGVAPDYDLAVLKIDAPAEKLKPLAIGTSGDLMVGQKAFAIGFPFGFDHTFTSGLIGGLNRELQTSVSGPSIKQAIQTDAAINPGNSGGPLLDSSGRLIGVNAAIYSDTGNYAGVGFAIPVDIVNEVVPDLIEDGVLSTPGIGVQLVADIDVFVLIQLRKLNERGVLLSQVREGGPADKLGLKPSYAVQGDVVIGDLIISIAGQRVRSTKEFLKELRSHKIGETIEIVFLRDGEEITQQIQLEKEPSPGG
ncbi:MAG: trypsin-like peptidase domain-containing protein [Planctomycetaceae bacterium]